MTPSSKNSNSSQDNSLSSARSRQLLHQYNELSEELLARQIVDDPLLWLTCGTRTKDEQDQTGNPYKPFPNRPYIRPLLNAFENERVILLPKSRTMMASWTVAGFMAYKMFTRAATRICFQSEDQKRAIDMVRYVKILWDQSLGALKRRWPLPRDFADIYEFGKEEFWLANGSSCIALVGNPDKLRSEHPTYYVADEAGLMTRFNSAFSAAMGSKCLGGVCIGTAEPSQFFDLIEDGEPIDWPKWEGCDAPRGWSMDGFRQPCTGLTAFRTPKNYFVARLHYSADPTMTEERIEQIRQDQPSEAHFQKEFEIKPYALQGQLVYPTFNRKLHVVPDKQVVYEDYPVCKTKRRGTCYMAIDPHPRTPHAGLWIMIDRWDDWWIYRDMWPSDSYAKTTDPNDNSADEPRLVWEYAELIASLEGNHIEWSHGETQKEFGRYHQNTTGERICERYMDQAGKGFYIGHSAKTTEAKSMWNAYYDYGIECSNPYKVHRPGENAIRELLQERKHSLLGKWPRLHIAASCRELILEFERYRYKKARRNDPEKELIQEPIESRSHMLDCLRYLATADLGYSQRWETSIYVGS